MQGTILLVEDEAAIAAFVRTALEREGFAVEVVEGGRQALARVSQSLPDLMILDLMLSDVDGLDVCRAVRRMPTYVPIIMLTARTEDVDKVVGLELGADDYITKPFNTRELIARVRAVLRLARSRATIEGLLSGDYRVQAAVSDHVAEYYNNAPDEASATEVTVNAPNDAPDIDFALNPISE